MQHPSVFLSSFSVAGLMSPGAWLAISGAVCSWTNEVARSSLWSSLVACAVTEGYAGLWTIAVVGLIRFALGLLVGCCAACGLAGLSVAAATKVRRKLRVERSGGPPRPQPKK